MQFACWNDSYFREYQIEASRTYVAALTNNQDKKIGNVISISRTFQGTKSQQMTHRPQDQDLTVAIFLMKNALNKQNAMLFVVVKDAIPQH